MDSSKNTFQQSPRNPSKSRAHYYFTSFFALILIVFYFSSSEQTSPAISYTSLASRAESPINIVQPVTRPEIEICRTCDVKRHQSSRNTVNLKGHLDSCDVFDGHWILDEVFEPIYEPGSCPFIDDSFNCFKNGRMDSDYLRLKWKPHHCEIPRFDGLKMLNMLKGKRMVFVGDSLNRNMWESLVCALRGSLVDKNGVFEISGKQQFRSQGFYSFRFKDFNCSINFVKSPFLVQEWNFANKAGTHRETLRLDRMESSYDKYHDADIIIFNTGHWWTHQKSFKGKYNFQEGSPIYRKLKVKDVYSMALRTWARWVDDNIDSRRSKVLFMGYSASHFKGGQWNSGGSCYGETQPIRNDTQLSAYPWMMETLENLISKMKTPVLYMNITRMTDYRKEGHPSIFRQMASKRKPGMIQDCSHWCLPGVPDSWNQLLYTILLAQHKEMS